jgi:mannose-6-phosphate isomerase-like protein (cupin superfamily)
MAFDTRQINRAPDVLAPDGSEVRILCRSARGSMAQFRLPAGAVSRAVAHRTVEEIWCVVSGRGRIWRRLDDHEEVVAVRPGTSITIPVGTRFQFRADEGAPLTAVAVTMPPWPDDSEAFEVPGPWPATV